MVNKIKIGTRGSRLAIWQADYVRKRILENFPDLEIEIVRIKTKGDRILDAPLSKIGGKGLFVKEIEDALLRGDIDIAVHSIKDIPTNIPEGLEISAMTERDDPHDVFISKDGIPFSELSIGAVIGTSSLRRQAQLLHKRPDLRFIPLRGNVDTRLRKLKEEQMDGIVLALAGIERMGFDDIKKEILPMDICLPAVGQGSIGIETRKSDDRIREIVSRLNHEETSIAIRSERAFLRKLEGGCQVPIAAHGRVRSGIIELHGMVATLKGEILIRDCLTGTLSDPEEIGYMLAERILNAGGRKILEDIYGKGRLET